MTVFDDILRILSSSDRDLARLTSRSQKQLIELYLTTHTEILNYINSLLQIAKRDKLTKPQMISLIRSRSLAEFIEVRIQALDSRLAGFLSSAGPHISSIVQEQVQAELFRMGLGGVLVTPPDPSLLEKHLDDALRFMSKWNRNFRRELLRHFREGILKGENYSELAKRMQQLRTANGVTPPVARARAHALANTRFALVRAANAAREEIYKNSKKEHGLEVQKMWLAAIDGCCRSCALLHAQIVDVGKQFEWKDLGLSVLPYKGQLPHPPLHPNCRCRIVAITSDILTLTDMTTLRAQRQHRLSQLSILKRRVA